jgi:tryptophan-rich sensory protein
VAVAEEEAAEEEAPVKFMKIQPLKLLISLAVPFTAAIVGSYFTFDSIPTWYAGLSKPFFSPPNYIFGPVWTILYFMMGLALYLVWINIREDRVRFKKNAIIIFIIQLMLNALWSIVFFTLHNPLLALLVIIILWFLILMNILAFARVSKTAAYLLFPYLLWVGFASILNAAIFILNS